MYLLLYMQISLFTTISPLLIKSPLFSILILLLMIIILSKVKFISVLLLFNFTYFFDGAALLIVYFQKFQKFLKPHTGLNIIFIFFNLTN